MISPRIKILMIIFLCFVFSSCDKYIIQNCTIQQYQNTAKTKTHINDVTRTQLALDIEGIGKAYSDKIVSNRDTLGPFTSSEDFEQRMFKELGDKTIYKVLQEYDFIRRSHDFENDRAADTARNTDITNIQRRFQWVFNFHSFYTCRRRRSNILWNSVYTV